MFAETLKKLANMPFFLGETKSLKMIKENPGNQALEDAAKSHTEVRTNVFDTLDYALGIWGKAEDLLYQKNLTNAKARGTVFYREQPLLVDMPVDQLLGLEARLTKIKADADPAYSGRQQNLGIRLAKGCYLSPEEYTVKAENIEVPLSCPLPPTSTPPRSSSRRVSILSEGSPLSSAPEPPRLSKKPTPFRWSMIFWWRLRRPVCAPMKPLLKLERSATSF